MRHFLNFILLLVKSILFIWIIAFVIVLILFVVGNEANGLTLSEKITTAAVYGFYVGAMFGSLLAIYISARTWRTEIKNKRVKARLEKAKKPDRVET